MKPIDATKHILIPEHIKLTDKQKEQLFEEYNVSLLEMPKIHKKDPAIANLDAKKGDIIKIIRKSLTSGESIFYRGVI